MGPDIPASIKARLLSRAKDSGDQFELFLVRYACERFLYRLGASVLREKLVLKGAGLLTLWMGDPYRATRDLDFLAFAPSDPESIRKIVETICAVPCPVDGLSFDLDSLELLPIRNEEDYQGQRAVLRAYLGKARIRLQADFGFGDAVMPGPEDAEYPTLLEGLPAPRLRIYPRVATIAEKFEAMVHLGRRNSRMKDFHDIWMLSSAFAFEGGELAGAVAACFARRGTEWTSELPDVLDPAFYKDADLRARWSAYLQAGAFRTPPSASFESVGGRIRSFLEPVRDSLVTGNRFDLHWEPGGPWGASNSVKV